MTGNPVSRDLDDQVPTIRVIRGNPTAAELAALVVVLAARPSQPRVSQAVAGVTSGWVDRSAGLRKPLRPGPGSWRRSGWR